MLVFGDHGPISFQLPDAPKVWDYVTTLRDQQT